MFMNEELVMDQNSEITPPVSLENNVSDVSIDEGFIVSGLGPEFNHSLLLNRDQADQHTIDSVTGLREELDSIVALGPVYSDRVNHAEYFLWKDRNVDKEFRDGRFVSLCEDVGQIDICGGSNIFGVTVKSAAVIGNQDDIERDYSYGLVARSGLVSVRCEMDVNIGDNVVSNSYGVAKRTDDKYGCAVVGFKEVDGISHAIILLSDSINCMHDVSVDVDRLSGRVKDAETNIVSAINVANEAHNLANDMTRLSKEIDKKVEEAVSKAESSVQTTEGFYEAIQDASAKAEESKDIAKIAETYAESIKNEAIATANDAWAKAENVSKEFLSLCAKIDTHSVGEYSQAYGLTMEQAASILQEGMIYVPTKHAGDGSHTEVYVYEDGREVSYTFTPGRYYTWDGGLWKGSASQSVYFSSVRPIATDEYIYWYTGNDIQDEKYNKQTLYLYQDGEWMAVATLSGNYLNRSVSMIQQESNRISLSVTTAQNAIAELDVRIDEESEKIGMVVGTDRNVKAHVIVQAINDDSSVSIKADKIAMTGTTTFLSSKDVGETGETIIDGGRIQSGLIDAKYINADTLKVNAANITGSLTVSDNKNRTLFKAGDNSVNIAGWNVDSNSLYCGNSFDSSTAFLCTGSVGNMTIAGHTGTNWVLKAGEHFGVNADGELYCNKGTFSGTLEASRGSIAGFDISDDGLSKTTEPFNSAIAMCQDVVTITPRQLVFTRELYNKYGDELTLTNKKSTSILGGHISVSLVNSDSFLTVEKDGKTYAIYIDTDMTVKAKVSGDE